MSASVARGVQRKHEAAPSTGTITRTLARTCPLTLRLSINRGDPEELPDAG